MFKSLSPFLILSTPQGEQEFVLEEDRDLKIGRSDDNEIIILDQWVSRHHAIIKKVDKTRYSLIDLDTKNGTFINEQTINLPTILNNGDVIRLGHTKLTFHVPTLTFVTDPEIAGVTNMENSDLSEKTYVKNPDLSGETYLKTDQISEVEIDSPPLCLISVVVIHLDNLIELEQILHPQIKLQLLEDLYYQLQECLQDLGGYLFMEEKQQYLIGLWSHNELENEGFEGIKMIKILLSCQQINNELQTKYTRTFPLILKCFIHTDLEQTPTIKSWENMEIQELLQIQAITKALNLLDQSNSLNIEFFWSQNAYKHLVYFPLLTEKLHCYLLKQHFYDNPKIYGIKLNVFEQINLINPGLEFIQSIASEIFATILNTQIGLPLDYDIFNLSPNSVRYKQLMIYLQEIKIFQIKLTPEIEVELELILGITEGGNKQTFQHFSQSLTILQNSDNLIRKACLNYCLASYFYGLAWLNLLKEPEKLNQAKFYFQECYNYFEKLDRKDRLAKMIHFLGEIVTELKEWEELPKIIKKAIFLHRAYSSALHNAQDLAYLAEMNIAQSEYKKAEKLMKKAFLILIEQQNLIEETFLEDQGWFLLLIGEIQYNLGQIEEAIKNLNRGKICLEYSSYFPRQIKLLNILYLCYIQQKQFLNAFKIKQEKEDIEQQYNQRYFRELGNFKTRKIFERKKVISSYYYQLLLQEKSQENLLLSARNNESNYLVNKINTPGEKILLLYSKNTEGKSSLLQLGILPLLESNYLDSQWSYYLINNYYKWLENIGSFLLDILTKIKPQNNIKTRVIQEINDLKNLAEIVNNNLPDQTNILIIFDQLERFFCLYSNHEHQKNLWLEFIIYLQELNHFKLIFSLNIASISNLLELNNYKKEEKINSIFELKNCYKLEPFKAQKIQKEWTILSQKFNFPFTPELITIILKDLTQETEEIKPIALQIIMSQLEKKAIFTLEDYQHNFGDNSELRLVKIWQEFLDSILEYFGENNQELGKLILYLLTEKQGEYCVAKTIRELIKDLKLINYSFRMQQKITMILEILVEANILLKILTPLEIQYQLLHPILIPYIRQLIPNN